jgi:hypothetical protein
MSGRTIGSRLRRIGVCIALPVALAGLSAQAADAQTFNVTNGTQLFNAVNTANSTPGFNVIQIGDNLILPSQTQSMVITGNLEITGPPQLQPSQFNPPGQQPDINAQNQVASTQPLFTIEPGANVIFKAFDLISAGGVGFPAVRIAGGNLELDNGSFSGNIGDGVDLSGGTLTTNNFLFSSNDDAVGSGSAIDNEGGSVTLNNSTLAHNDHGGVTNGFVAHNTVLYQNAPDCIGSGATSDVNSEDDDLTCNVTFGGGAPNIGPAQFNGGPTLTAAPQSGSDAIGAGNFSWCARSDARFFNLPVGATSCDIGEVQTTATMVADTTGPVCTIFSKNESTNPSVPSTEQVNAVDSGAGGVGADAIGNTTIVLKSNPSTTNGTVAYPTVPGTLFDATSPTSNILDQPSGSPFPVTASKPAGDLTVNDTQWSFTATDWLSNQTLCQ